MEGNSYQTIRVLEHASNQWIGVDRCGERRQNSLPNYSQYVNLNSEIVVLVDANDKIVGEAPRHEVRQKGLIHRVTYILVVNRLGQLLLQKRTPIKDIFPGCFDAAAGGVVTRGESYEASAARELEEELGIRDASLDTHFDHYYDDGFNRYWGRVFSCRHEGPFSLQESEVESAQFVEISRILANEITPLTPDTLEVLKRWLSL